MESPPRGSFQAAAGTAAQPTTSPAGSPPAIRLALAGSGWNWLDLAGSHLTAATGLSCPATAPRMERSGSASRRCATNASNSARAAAAATASQRLRALADPAVPLPSPPPSPAPTIFRGGSSPPSPPPPVAPAVADRECRWLPRDRWVVASEPCPTLNERSSSGVSTRQGGGGGHADQRRVS
jgi:hypothetical protein